MTEERFLLPMSPPRVGVVMPLASVIVPLPEVSSALFCRARLLPRASVPFPTVVEPEKVFAPLSVWVRPELFMTREIVLVAPSLITPAKVRFAVSPAKVRVELAVPLFVTVLLVLAA